MFAAPSFVSATALGTGWAVVKVSSVLPGPLLPPFPASLFPFPLLIFRNPPPSPRQFAYNHRPTSIRRIQSRIEELLHLSPSTSSSLSANSSSITPARSSTDTTGSWFERIKKRAAVGSDAKGDEQADHSS